MKSETKAKLRTAGKFALKATGLVLDDMYHTAKRQSKNKQLVKEKRDQYADMAKGFKSLSESLGRYREKLEQVDSLAEVDDSKPDCGDLQNPDPPISEVAPCINTFSNIQKAQIQFEESSSCGCIDSSSVEEWNLQWISIGKLNDIVKSVYNQIGLIRLIVGSDTVFITRTIELKGVGLHQRIQELQNSVGKKSMIAHKIAENYANIDVLILVVGDSDEDIIVCRNLEKLMIQYFKPLWMERAT